MTTAAPTVEVAAITEADVTRVAEFLNANMKSAVPTERWASAIEVPWRCDRPNAGFMLVDGGDVVGASLAFYSERIVDGRAERFCNLGAWCVLPEYRFQGIRLLRTLLAQDGYHFTDLTPSGNVVKINSRLGFRHLDATTALVPHLRWPLWPGRGRVSSDPELLSEVLSGRDLEIFHDHLGARAARHLVLIRGDERCYVIFRKECWRRFKPKLFASILYVSNPSLFREMAGHAFRHLLLRHGAVASLAEDRIVKERPRLSFRVRPPRPRMFLSATLEPDQVDYLYSELVCVPW